MTATHEFVVPKSIPIILAIAGLQYSIFYSLLPHYVAVISVRCYLYGAGFSKSKSNLQKGHN
jgi:hypothetical protein